MIILFQTRFFSRGVFMLWPLIFFSSSSCVYFRFIFMFIFCSYLNWDQIPMMIGFSQILFPVEFYSVRCFPRNFFSIEFFTVVIFIVGIFPQWKFFEWVLLIWFFFRWKFILEQFCNKKYFFFFFGLEFLLASGNP